jgi:hypothetical protein
MGEVVAFHAKTRVWRRHTNKYAETKTQYETVSSWDRRWAQRVGIGGAPSHWVVRKMFVLLFAGLSPSRFRLLV